MVKYDFEEIARCGSSHGVNGGFVFAGDEEVLEQCLGLGFLFIRMKDGSPVPFQIESVEYKGEFIVFLDTIDNPEKAKILANRPILFPKNTEDIESIPMASESPYEDLVGYQLYDETSGRRVVIKNILRYPGQTMAEIDSGELIPIQDNLIVEIDRQSEKITVSLATGIWNM
ncbi:MAG: hypothetical protein GVX96_05475 [Bacteroidetes bacterium]|jgi:ribosomal 30S subunit maturation factor RimM|nr:hypothetical protein [Bacteroidota bacterium]